jgi:hypothetical protein
MCARGAIARQLEATMSDVLMLILGTGSFGLFLGYVAICDSL